MEEVVLVHKVHGLCKVIDKINLNNQEFAKVLILNDSNLVIYCPYPKMDEFFREPIKKEEIDNLYEYMRTLPPIHIDGSKKQRELITSLLYSGNIKDIAYLYIALERHKKEKSERKQTLSVVENRTLKSATNLLINEISFVTNQDKDSVEKKLINTIVYN